MRLLMLFLLCIILPVFILAQSQKSIKPSYQKPVFFEKTLPLKDLQDPVNKYKSSKEIENLLEFEFPETDNYYKYINDPVLQNYNGNGAPAKVLIATHAMNNSDYGIPPDTQGDVGIDYYFHSVNLSFVVLDKAGNTVYGPKKNMILWQNFPNINTTHGDPITIYDHLADRWITSVMASENGGPVYYELIAVSETTDPLGAWYTYAYELDGLPDYPKFGLWHNAYYWAANVFNLSTNEWIGAAAFAMERDKMLVGDPDAMMLRFQTQPGSGGFYKDPFSFLPTNLLGEVQATDLPNYFMYFKDNAWGFPNDFLSLWECNIDWNDTSNCSFNEVAQLQTEPFDSNVDNFSFITQPDPAYNLQSLCNRLMFRLDFRHFEDYNSMVTNHTVDCDGTDHAGVRWYELRDYGSGWSIYQQGTYAPDGDHRWMGSASIDSEGNIALGYSVSGDTTYPSVRVTGRRVGDSLGIMTIPEFSIMEGGGSQTNSSGRWGDYSCMSSDPVDDFTFWYVNEYYAYTNAYNWKSALGGFYFTSDSGMHTLIKPDTLFFSNSQQINQGIDLNILNLNPLNAAVLYNDPIGTFSNIDVNWYVYNPIPSPYFINSYDTLTLKVRTDYTDNYLIGDYHYDTMLLITSLDTHNIIIAFADSLLTSIDDHDFPGIIDFRIQPNPCRDNLNISFSNWQDEHIIIELSSIRGKLADRIVDRSFNSGKHTINYKLSGSGIIQGIYFITLRTETDLKTRKILVLN
ncbi:T9SS type A sorting domain-containing protein [Bacteroidota bacterium]